MINLTFRDEPISSFSFDAPKEWNVASLQSVMATLTTNLKNHYIVCGHTMSGAKKSIWVICLERESNDIKAMLVNIVNQIEDKIKFEAMKKTYDPR
jgi:hypothetical protein